MPAPSFHTIVSDSPVLSPPLKEELLRHEDEFSEAAKGEIIERLLFFEREVLNGTEEFLHSLSKSTTSDQTK